MTLKMRCKWRARGIPDLRTSWTDYSSRSAPAPLKTMAVSSSWGRAATRPRRTRGGPSDPSISDVLCFVLRLRRDVVPVTVSGRRWRVDCTPSTRDCLNSCACSMASRLTNVSAIILRITVRTHCLIQVYSRGSRATRFPPSAADAYMAAMQRTTSNPNSASMPRKCSRPRHALINAWTLSGPVPVSS